MSRVTRRTDKARGGVAGWKEGYSSNYQRSLALRNARIPPKLNYSRSRAPIPLTFAFRSFGLFSVPLQLLPHPRFRFFSRRVICFPLCFSYFRIIYLKERTYLNQNNLKKLIHFSCIWGQKTPIGTSSSVAKKSEKQKAYSNFDFIAEIPNC